MLFLTIEVTDLEVATELEKRPEGPTRDRYALSALRLGILAIRQANGELDAVAIREAGQDVLGQLERLLGEKGTEITTGIAGALRQYFDPATGALSQRIESLLKQDGDLERALRQHLGPGSSTIARTLKEHLDPLFSLLSPDDADGVKARIESMLEDAFEEQQHRILKEFSLDSEDSVLSRLVKRVRESNGDLSAGIKGHVDALIGEFSLDKPDSALSRLVQKVESAQKQIGETLTLDDDASPLSRLKRELQSTINTLVDNNAKFQAEVRETLGRLQAQRQAAAKSTLHGHTFEEQLGELLNAEANRLNDVFASTGATTGAIPKCKIGDFLTTLGPDTAAPTARIVWEAKSNKGYDLVSALDELGQARKNRQAQVGVFVFSKDTAPDGLEYFARYGNDLLIIWDPDDPSTDVYVKAAYSVARALLVRETHQSAESEQALNSIELSTRTIEKQIDHVTQIKTWAETVKSNGGKIADRAEKMEAELTRQVAELDLQLSALKTASAKE
jgi:hypothetical protein